MNSENIKTNEIEIVEKPEVWKQTLYAVAEMARQRIDAKPLMSKKDYLKRKKKNKQSRMSRKKNRS
jgi:hypothetical protein